MARAALVRRHLFVILAAIGLLDFYQGWVANDKRFVVCSESLDWVVQADGDGNEERRRGLAEVVARYSLENNRSIILVKGQDLDLDNGTPEKVKALLPDDIHEIIYLNPDFTILYERYKAKSWWDDSMTGDVCRQWAGEQLSLLNRLKENGFGIISLDSSNQLYLSTNFPNEIN